MDLPVLVSDGEQIMFPVVEEFVSRGLAAAASQVRKLVVAVEMNAECFGPAWYPVRRRPRMGESGSLAKAMVETG
jgi:hypothetical protein